LDYKEDEQKVAPSQGLKGVFLYLFVSEIISNRRLAADVCCLRLSAGDDFAAAVRPGCFVMLAPDAKSGLCDPLLRRPFGIVRCGKGWFEVVIKAIGKGSRRLTGLAAGERVAVNGPLGNGWPVLPRDGRPLLLAAGGIGIAAIAAPVFARPAAENLCLLYGAASRSELVLVDELKEATGGRLAVEVITDDGSSGRRGLVTTLLEEKLALQPDARVFVCGPEPMLRGVQKILAIRRVEGWLSLENRMACGFGVCLGCVQETLSGKRAKVCTEGPVFAAGEVVFNG
jgi:dihydroorotate dehydrogenase electron transfer subunit